MLKPCEVCKNKRKSENCRCRKWEDWFCIEWNELREFFRPFLKQKTVNEGE